VILPDAGQHIDHIPKLHGDYEVARPAGANAGRFNHAAIAIQYAAFGHGIRKMWDSHLFLLTI
jgi:hypothetical protein